jgi:hypothetical protein
MAQRVSRKIQIVEIDNPRGKGKKRKRDFGLLSSDRQALSTDVVVVCQATAAVGLVVVGCDDVTGADAPLDEEEQKEAGTVLERPPRIGRLSGMSCLQCSVKDAFKCCCCTFIHAILFCLRLKVCVDLSFDLQFDLRFGSCVGISRQENAFSARVTGLPL